MRIKGIGIEKVERTAEAIRITTPSETERVSEHDDPQEVRPLIGSEAYLQAMEAMSVCNCERCRFHPLGPNRLGGEEWVDGDYEVAEIFPPALVFDDRESDPVCPWGALEYALFEPHPEAVEYLSAFDLPVFINGFEYREFHDAFKAAKDAGLFAKEVA